MGWPKSVIKAYAVPTVALLTEVIEALQQWQEKIGKPPKGEELDGKDPRKLVAEALSYLRNNQRRMDYPRYRREGLPITSSLVESLVGAGRVEPSAGVRPHPSLDRGQRSVEGGSVRFGPVRPSKEPGRVGEGVDLLVGLDDRPVILGIAVAQVGG